MKKISHNKKVAMKRGEDWKKKLVQGKHEAQLNPTIIKKLRVAKGESQDTIAAKLGVSLATYGAIERGLRAVKKHLAQYIADCYDSKIEKLFSEIGGKFYASKAK